MEEALDLILRLHKEGHVTTEEAKMLIEQTSITVKQVPWTTPDIPWTTPNAPWPIGPIVTYDNNATSTTDYRTDVKLSAEKK